MLRVYYHQQNRILDKYLEPLREHREVELVNVSKTFMPYHHFLRILSALDDVADIFNKNARPMIESDEFQDMTLSELYHYCKGHPDKLRNNIVYSDEVIFIGFNDEVLDVFRSRESKRQSYHELLERIHSKEEVI